MKNRKEQYAEVVNSAAELADYFSDQEGGDYTLAIVCEILEALLEDGELPAAYVVIETACRLGDVDYDAERSMCYEADAYYKVPVLWFGRYR